MKHALTEMGRLVLAFGVLLLGLAVVTVQLALVTGVYAAGAVVGGLATMAWTETGRESQLPAFLLGASVVPLALTLGMAAWPAPQLFRMVRSGQADENGLVPRRRDVWVPLVVTSLVAVGCGGLLSDAPGFGRLEATFGAVALVGMGAIALAGGRFVALVWLRSVT